LIFLIYLFDTTEYSP